MKKNKFDVQEMSNESFLAFKNLTSDIVNRKTDIRGNKVQWLNIRWIRFKKEHPMQMLYKLTGSRLLT